MDPPAPNKAAFNCLLVIVFSKSLTSETLKSPKGKTPGVSKDPPVALITCKVYLAAAENPNSEEVHFAVKASAEAVGADKAKVPPVGADNTMLFETDATGSNVSSLHETRAENIPVSKTKFNNIFFITTYLLLFF
jgi:hypothetical protein